MCVVSRRLLEAVYLHFLPAFGGLIVLSYVLLVKAGGAKFLFNLFRFLNLSVSLGRMICVEVFLFCLLVGGG